MTTTEYIQANAVQKRLWNMDGLYIQITHDFACFVAETMYMKLNPDWRNMPDNARLREWHICKGVSRKIVMRGKKSGTNEDVMAYALEQALKYIESEKHMFDTAKTALSKIEDLS